MLSIFPPSLYDVENHEETEAAPVTEGQVTELGLKVEYTQHFRIFNVNKQNQMLLPWSKLTNLIFGPVGVRGGATVVILRELSTGNAYIGISACSLKDHYERRVGRELALDRALMAFSIQVGLILPQTNREMGELVYRQIPFHYLIPASGALYL